MARSVRVWGLGLRVSGLGFLGSAVLRFKPPVCAFNL